MGKFGPSAGYGIECLKKEMEKIGSTCTVTAGVYCENEEVQRLAKETGALPELTAEAFAAVADGNEVYLTGYDDSGLMYGCFELAERLKKGSAPTDFADKPYLKTRGLYELLHNRDLEKERFYSKEYWTEYFNMLAHERFNSYNLVVSHQTSYLAPVFAYFLREPKYAYVKPTDVDDETIDKNIEMLTFITRLAHERGISFILGIWQMRPWNSADGDWRPDQVCNVEGLSDEMFLDYTYCCTKRLLKEYPDIDGIQLRVNAESGIVAEWQTEFYKNSVFRAIAEADRPVLMDYRGWCAYPETTEAVIEMCPNLRTSMKYWGEFLGAPYQPARISPAGYGSGDLLKKPMPYRFLWQIWSLGSPRLLLWGDPEYVKRMVKTANICNTEGFEINPHLAQKGYGNDPGYWRIFKNPEDEYYTHEYERYWMFYRLIGRLAYNPDADSSIWEDELESRIGNKAADPVMDAYIYASRVITFLVQNNLSDFNMYVWPEIDCGGTLELYKGTVTSDKCVICTAEEYVEAMLAGRPEGRLSPLEAADMLEDWSRRIMLKLREAEECSDEAGKELLSTIVDFKLMANLAGYHAYKLRAAVELEYYIQTKDGGRLYRAYDFVRQATVRWEQLSITGSERYYDDMVTGPLDVGCWFKKMPMVYEDELRIAQLIDNLNRYGLYAKGFDFGENDKEDAFFESRQLRTFTEEKLFRAVHSETESEEYGFCYGDVKYLRMYKPRMKEVQLDVHRRDALWPNEQIESRKGYRSPLYEDYAYGRGKAGFACALPNGSYQVDVVLYDCSKDAKCHGPMSMWLNRTEIMADETVMPLVMVRKHLECQVTDGRLTLEFDGDWFISALVVTPAEPAIAHCPLGSVFGGEKPLLSCTAYGGTPEAVFTDKDGNERRVTMEKEYPHVYYCPLDESAVSYKLVNGAASTDTCTIRRFTEKPVYHIIHEAVSRAYEGEDLPVSVKAACSNGIRRVELCYGRLDQTQPMERVEMKKANEGYEAVIPGEYITAEWDMLYYFEITGEDGSGLIYPDFRERTPYYIVEINSKKDLQR